MAPWMSEPMKKERNMSRSLPTGIDRDSKKICGDFQGFFSAKKRRRGGAGANEQVAANRDFVEFCGIFVEILQGGRKMSWSLGVGVGGLGV